MTFLPGLTDPESAPFGQFDWENINILKGYIDNYDGTNYGSAMPWDLAVITLAEDAGNQLGWIGFRVDDASQWAATIIGYPGDKPDGTMWTVSCDIAPDQFGDQIFYHTCDTFAGSSAPRCTKTPVAATSTSAASTSPKTTRSITASASSTPTTSSSSTTISKLSFQFD